MALTDNQVKKAAAGEKPQKPFDSHGVFLLVTTAGFKSWRPQYRFGGKEKLLVIRP